MLKSRPWYKKWWGILLVIPILPLFGLWYVWIELERSKAFRLGATAFLLAIYTGGVMSLVYALPTSSHPKALTAKHITTTPKSLVTSKLSNSVATNNSSTQSNKTSQTTSKASSTTIPTKIATTPSRVATSSTTSQTTTTAPPETLLQQFPNTYPSQWANASLDTVIDTWGMYNRESVSYTAWKVNEAFGNMPTSWSGYCNITTPTPNGPPSVRSYPDGDAICWPQNAQTDGIPTGLVPKLHSVGIESSGIYSSTGFSVWVEAVNGNQVTVSSYNGDDTGNYNVETITPQPGTFQYIYFN